MNTIYETIGQLRVIGCCHELLDPRCETELWMLGSDRCKSGMRAVQQHMMLIINPATAAIADTFFVRDAVVEVGPNGQARQAQPGCSLLLA